MREFSTQALPKQIGIAALAALGMNGAIILIQWYVVSPIGFGGIFVLQAMLFGLFLPLIVIFLAVPVSLFFLPFRNFRRHAVTVLTCGLVYVLIGFPLVRLSFPVRMQGFERLASRSEPLVTALHKYVQEEGRPPVALQDLVPRYLPGIPKTGMPAYPEYRYSTETDWWDGNPWVLYVDCMSGFFNFDMFMYFPEQNYPKRGYGGFLERIGEWAYVHE